MANIIALYNFNGKIAHCVTLSLNNTAPMRGLPQLLVPSWKFPQRDGVAVSAGDAGE